MAHRGVRYSLPGIAAIVACTALLAATAVADDPQAGTGDLLPDLDQQVPTGLTVGWYPTNGKTTYAVGFQSAVRNVGAGPLIIEGRRPSTETPTMTAHQLIDAADGSQRAVPVSSRLRYTVSPTHQHWHLLRFDRYELRRAGRGSAIVRDQKTGFCLGDRYRVVSYEVPAAAPQPQYTGNCGRAARGLLNITEGISPGYGDNYLPYLEGQSLPLTGLAAGGYVLTHRVNSDRALVESNYANDAASVLLDLRWRGTRPVVRVLRSCPDTARCDKAQQARSAFWAGGLDRAYRTWQ
jgi:hypothetical protein